MWAFFCCLNFVSNHIFLFRGRRCINEGKMNTSIIFYLNLWESVLLYLSLVLLNAWFTDWKALIISVHATDWMFVLTAEKKASGFLCMCPVPNSLKQGRLFLACADLYRNEKEPTPCRAAFLHTCFFITHVKEVRNVGSLIFWTPLNTSEFLQIVGIQLFSPPRLQPDKKLGAHPTEGMQVEAAFYRWF